MTTAWNTVAPAPDPESPSFKVEVLAQGETKFVSNALRFATIEAASDYASDLAGRWFAVVAWQIVGSEDEANR